MRKWLMILVLAASGAAQAAEADVSRLRLRACATVYGADVTLGDVLVLSDATAEAAQGLADKPLFAEQPSGNKLTVTHEQIVRRLEELGVNLGRVLVSGAARCEIAVQRGVARPAGETALAADEQMVRPRGRQASEAQTLKSAGAQTLAEVLRGLVDRELKDLKGQAELQYERAGQEFLTLTTPPYEFVVSSTSSDKLGLREFRVVIRQGGRVQRTVQVTARVRLTREVLVAKRPLSIGNFVREDDVALEARVFDDATGLGLGEPGQAVGQQVKKFVPVGALVGMDALKAVDLVQRARPVTVIGAGSNVQVRLTGVALDSGGYGDSVRVRLGDARSAKRELRGTVAGMGMVRVAEVTQ